MSTLRLERFEELHEKLDLGTATAEERSELTQLISADPACRRALVAASLRDAQLRKLVAAAAAPATLTVAPGARRWQRVAGLAAAALFLFAAAWLLWLWQSPPPRIPGCSSIRRQ